MDVLYRNFLQNPEQLFPRTLVNTYSFIWLWIWSDGILCKHLPGVIVVSILWTLNIFHTFFYSLYCWLRTGKCLLIIDSDSGQKRAQMSMWVFLLDHIDTEPDFSDCVNIAILSYVISVTFDISDRLFKQFWNLNSILFLWTRSISTDIISFFKVNKWNIRTICEICLSTCSKT